ncbi:DNA excision repair protein ERCC-6-like [Physella acuta]|uniref:DNA excision repair protein ERCC-6-like n=1 Tax=Physella acuta TaxID=109671 RepID=UPI0027DDB3A8|nr:DNA excision repair protein ERCC-6-like [Physella acuta]
MDLEEKLSSISLNENNSNRLKLYSSDDSSTVEKTRLQSEESESSSDSAERQKFMQLVTKARQLAEKGDIAKAIILNEKAFEIHQSDKLKKRIAKMKAFLADQECDDENDSQMKSLGQGFMLHARLHEKIYSHQKEGILWLWSLYLLGKGGILADDMGLGKTIQVIAFLAGMFDMNKIKTVMIVVPLSVMPNWLNEFNKWTPGINVVQFHGGSKKERERALAKVRTRGGVLMTTYGLVITTKETFSERHGQEFIWDYVILDEGHKIKNPTKTSKSVHQIPARHRIILTGTPVQNNLKELWSLFDYVHQGSLLGTVRTFKMEFETPIIRARERDATAVEKKLGQEMAETLKGIIKPYFLRRTKAEVQDARDSNTDPSCLKMPNMTRKNDLVLWLHLTETQQKIYQDFTSLDHVKELLMTKKSPLVALTVLKKICDHPRLLSSRACLQLGLDGEDFDEEELENPESYECAATKLDKISDDILINESGKMQILVELLDTFKSEGRQTLVFSQSRKLLNIIQKVITNRGHKVARLDGTITQLTERDEIVKKFQRDPSYSVFLLTIQVGGVGLTITAADRVIIYDPNWNPATDAQAVDRVYRIGQQKNVVVYRLITCGTVEEKIYRRQVFKDSITRQTTGNSKNPYRYFTKMELRELFTLDDPKFSKTQRQLQDLHSDQRQSDTALDEHIAYLHSLDIFGISDHDLMFKQTDVRDDEEDDVIVQGHEENENNERFIQHRIHKAQMLIAEESTVPISYEERSKGLMRFPTAGRGGNSTNQAVPTSALFSQVKPSSHVENVDLVTVSDDESDDHGSRYTAMEDTEDSEHSSENVNVKKEISADTRFPQKELHPSPSVKNKSRNALQPLSSDEVQQRSPHVASRKGEIFTEEILISPDACSPIIGFEKVNMHRKIMEEAMKMSSFPSSPIRPGINSPKRQLGFSPSKLANSSIKGNNSPKYSSSKTKINLASIGTTSTPQENQKLGNLDVLVKNSPDSGSRTPGLASSAGKICPPATNMYSTPVDMLEARRKLMFVSDSADNSPSLSSPLKKKNRLHDLSRSVLSTPDAVLEKCEIIENSVVEDSCVSVNTNPGSSTASPNTSTHCRSLLSALNESSRSAGRQSAKKNQTNKRRSVCMKKPVLDDSSDESRADDSFDENDKTENVESVETTQDEEDEDDKENDPILIKRVGGRNRIVSDSESEGGSCYEVEVSEDDDVQVVEASDEENQNPVEKDDVVKEERNEDVMEEEDENVDEELNARFQDLIKTARSLYKKQNYVESLQFVEEALQIFQDPGLEQMADKIRARISEQS